MSHKFFAKTQFIGKKVVSLPECHSTNEIAMSIVNHGHGSDGMVIITSNQTKGKGQRGNTWESEAGKNLTYSIIIKTDFINLTTQFDLHKVVSLAVFEALSLYLDEGLKIKWPNDIYYDDDKLGGILIENTIRGLRLEFSVIGIGINVNQKKFNIPKASSMQLVTGKKLDPIVLGEQILLSVEGNLKKVNVEDLLLKHHYEKHLYQINEARMYQDQTGQRFVGIIKGVSKVGKLKIERENKIYEYDFKEIVFL